MTFWDFYGQHPVLGTIVVLLAFLLLLAVVVAGEAVLLAPARLAAAMAEKRKDGIDG